MTTWPTPNGSGANGSTGNGHSANGNGYAQSSMLAASAPRRKRRKQGIKKAKDGCRRPLMMYDRVKVSLLLVGIFFFLSLLKMADNPLVSFVDAVRMTFNSYGWILTLVSLDVLRQMHYLAAEKFAGYWSVVGRIETFVKKPWNRLSSFTQYRFSRILRFAMILVVGAFLFSAAFDTEPIRAWMEALVRLWQAVPTILQFVAYLLLAIGQFVAIFWFLSKGGVEVLMPEDIKTSFDDVWGQDQVVSRVKETLSLLEDPDLIEAKGGYVPGGILLYGPPGTGKTLIAEALAGETGKPFVLIEPGAFQAMFIGVNILKVKSLYRRLRKLALRYGGVVAFFDEADVLGRRALSTGGQGGLRTGAMPLSFGHDSSYDSLAYLSPVSQSVVLGHHDSMVGAKTDRLVVPGGGGDLGTLNAILASMQGLKKPRGFINRIKRALGMKPSNPPKYRILHVMATNLPDSLDEALLRPGRIDRKFRVGYPSREGRIRTYRGYLDKVRHTLTNEDVERLATSSPYASGAVIKDIVNEGLMAAIRDGREVIEWRDIVAAKSLKEYGVTDGFEYIDRERHAVAVHEACHAVAAYRLKADFQIDVATIERRGDVGGFVSRVPVVERMFEWKTEIENDIQISIASLVGERMFFDGDSTNGVTGDLDNATRLALVMESRWGMGETLASHQVLVAGSAGGAGRGGNGTPDDEAATKVSPVLGERVEQRLREIYDRTKALLEENRYEVLSLAHALEWHRTLNGSDVEAVINRTRGPIIDGTVYGVESVRATIDAYHAEAVHLHRTGQGQPRLPDVRAVIAATLSASAG
ncbi:MAG: AAA family ATPase [Ilumatobacteraceae bacterium]